MLHGKVMRDDSTPKKTATNKKPSMSGFCRLCTESSFEIIYGNFPSKSSARKPSEAQQPKPSYVSMDNICNVSCRKAEERLSLNFILEMLGFTTFQNYSLPPCVKEQQMIPGQRK